jgi:DNA repair exonuclease SbcCD ATPase subunit
MAKKISEQDIKNLQRYQAEEAIGAKMREGHARSLDEITDATMKLAVYEARATAGLDKRTKVYKQINKDVEKLKGMLADEEKLREKINKHLGSTDNLLRGIKKIPFIGQFIDAEKIIKNPS